MTWSYFSCGFQKSEISKNAVSEDGVRTVDAMLQTVDAMLEVRFIMN